MEQIYRKYIDILIKFIIMLFIMAGLAQVYTKVVINDQQQEILNLIKTHQEIIQEAKAHQEEELKELEPEERQRRIEELEQEKRTNTRYEDDGYGYQPYNRYNEDQDEDERYY